MSSDTQNISTALSAAAKRQKDKLKPKPVSAENAAAAAQRGFAAAAAAVPAATPPSAAHKPRRVTKAERLHRPAAAPAARRCTRAPSPAPVARRPSLRRTQPRLLAFSSACGLTLAAACTVVAGIWCCPHHSPPTAPYHVAAAAGLP